jgi:signal transduction histidine kinase/DNA-binding response OmpR family regulator
MEGIAASLPDERVNILIVDDLPDKLLAFRSVLEELDQNLVLVGSGADALRELLQRDFAVILLDVNMPDIDGIETAELIRRHGKTAHTPIIFVTAYADEMQTARGYALGAVDYILSPIVPEILRSKVRVFVELYRVRRRAEILARAEADRAAAEEAKRRSEFISRVGRELSSSLDLEQSMTRLLELLVPTLGDLGLLAVTAPDSGPAAADAAHRADADRESDGAESDAKVILLGRSKTEPVRPFGPLEALPPMLLRAVDAAHRDGQRVDVRLHAPNSSAWPAELRGAHVVPLRTGEVSAGVLVLGTTALTAAPAEDAALAEIASRAAIAFENARLYGSLKREMARSKEAEERLQLANRRKDEFLAMLSHELRNPLAPILSATHIMRKISPTHDRIAWARDIVERQVTHLAKLVDDLLDVSRITQGKINLRKEPVELGSVIAHGVETSRSLLDAKHHHLTVDLPPVPIWVFGDFSRLSQVVGNLLNNAAKYTPDGGRLEIKAAADRGHAVVSVRDNGVGIDPQFLPHVFELFAQGERSLDRSQGGLGVGLTVVHQLVGLHQGRIEVSSEGIGKGAEFRVVLPCISEVAQRDKSTAEQSTGKARGVRILVVDDNIDAAESLAVFFRLEGHEVKVAADGQEALACMEVFAPHVALIDIGLPGMSGYEVAERICESRAGAPSLMIAVTGYGQHEDQARARACGFHHHFVKPADPVAIQAIIAAHREHPCDPEQSAERM